MTTTNSWTLRTGHSHNIATLIEPEKQMEESDDDEHEPSLFDILDDDAKEDPEDDVPEDQQA